jgi:DNA-binding response OmpR family regulator
MIRILIAEDEQRIASFIDKGLSAAGFTTTVVADGASAYEYARGSQFDLMILDLGLPVRDGLTVLRYGTLALDLRTRFAHVNDQLVELTAREFTLAEVLLRHPGQVLSREQLLDHVWGLDFDPGSNIVDVYVRYLRRKLGTERIETVRGMGYRLTAGL